MAIPEATLTIKDGGLGLSAGDASGTPAFIGACSSGTANTVYQFSDPTTLKETLGTGPLVEAALHSLAVAGGPVICVKAPSSTAGAAAAPSATQTGTAELGTPAGGSLDAYDAKIVIVTGGATLAAGTATWKYSLDGGKTYSGELAMPTSGIYAVPNTGLTFTWTYTSGTAFVAGDQWTFAATGPSYTLSEAQTALDALIADASADFFLVHIVGAASSAANAATMYAAIESKMQSAASTYFRYARAIIETPDDTDNNQKTAFASVAGTRTLVGAGSAYLISQNTGVAFKRNAAWVATARAAALQPHEDLGKVRAGAHPGVHSLVRDEGKTPGLDAARFVTLRTIIGKQGYYVTTGRIMAPTGSDYSLLQYGRVVDIASKEIRASQLEYLNDEVEVDRETGRILESAAIAIESYIEGRVRAVTTQQGRASDIQVTVDRTINMLSLQKLVVRYRLTPLAYAKTIEGELALFNPALAPV